MNICNYLPSEAGVVNEPQLIRCRLGELTGSGKGGSLSEELAQAAEHILALLAPGGEQALQGRVAVSQLPTSSASADFLLNLARTQISLGLVVGEGNSFFQGKAQHRGFVLLQTSRQVAAFGRPRFEGGFQGSDSVASACSSKR